jgi:hypothetical protein
MRRTTLAEESNTFATCAEEARNRLAADKSARRRLETARRRVIRSITRVCYLLNDDELIQVADHVLLITA